MDTPTKPKKQTKRPFKQTCELIKLALNDGWSQAEIATKCRTQQSVVSAWKNGSKKATEAQLEPLLKIYGHKLRRKAFKVYWAFNETQSEKAFYKVEGQVILSAPFCDPRRNHHGKVVKKIPLKKLVIHHQGKEQFIVVHQKRLEFKEDRLLLENNNQDAAWASKIYKVNGVSELLKYIEKYADEKLIEDKYIGDAATLPFLLRQALLNHGLHVEGIVEYPAVW